MSNTLPVFIILSFHAPRVSSSPRRVVVSSRGARPGATVPCDIITYATTGWRLAGSPRPTRTPGHQPSHHLARVDKGADIRPACHRVADGAFARRSAAAKHGVAAARAAGGGRRRGLGAAGHRRPHHLEPSEDELPVQFDGALPARPWSRVRAEGAGLRHARWLRLATPRRAGACASLS